MEVPSVELLLVEVALVELLLVKILLVKLHSHWVGGTGDRGETKNPPKKDFMYSTVIVVRGVPTSGKCGIIEI